jgi:phosphoribosylanthranilate isomerase
LVPIVKICGLKTKEAVLAAKDADYFGFIFFPPSPRNVTAEIAENIRQYGDAEAVAVTVDPTDSFLQDIFSRFRPDYIQLHGSETPERVKEIKKKFFLPVIKALKIKTPADIDKAAAYEMVADLLMFDAGAGGSGTSFDWNLLKGKVFKKPYFLSGGINKGNVENALRITDAKMLDISSGLESSPGNKDPEMIAEFIKQVKSISV